MTKVNKSPLVSVVMPVFNAGNFLRPAVESILNQSHKNLELIIVDDASTDGTSKILKFYKKLDSRVRVFRNKKNLNVSKTSSIGILHAKGEFIARMDADDIAHVSRIEKQVKFLMKNKGVVAVGGQCELIDVGGTKIGEKSFPLKDSEIRETIFSHVPLQQPTLMVNRNLIPSDFIWYDENYSSAEELELIFKLFKFGKVMNLKDTVLKYRMHSGNTSLINPKKTFYLTLKTRVIAVLKYGYMPSFRGVLTTLLQAMVITMLPASFIYPIYAYLRGMKKITFKSAKINWNVQVVKA